MKKLFTGILCGLTMGVVAQEKGTVSVVKDPMIDSLIARRIALNVKSAVTTPEPGVSNPAKTIVSQMGFRVQIFYGSDRRQVFNEQARFSSLYPAVNTYVTYKEPNYYLRVGDFRTRLEAQRLMNELRGAFPTMFIFREKINTPI
jgi:hypothetical protein